MLIQNLPTPALRARAAKLAWAAGNEKCETLQGAFDWKRTAENYDFWHWCDTGHFDAARVLQPDLFKPFPGKPHVKIRETHSGGFRVEQNCNGPLNLQILLWQESIMPRPLENIGEAARAWHSYRRSV